MKEQKKRKSQIMETENNIPICFQFNRDERKLLEQLYEYTFGEAEMKHGRMWFVHEFLIRSAKAAVEEIEEGCVTSVDYLFREEIYSNGKYTK